MESNENIKYMNDRLNRLEDEVKDIRSTMDKLSSSNDFIEKQFTRLISNTEKIPVMSESMKHISEQLIDIKITTQSNCTEINNIKLCGLKSYKEDVKKYIFMFAGAILSFGSAYLLFSLTH